MAGALVGGAFLSAFLQVLFDRMASPEVVDFIGGRKLTDGLLRKLKLALLSVNAVLEDAEEKQFTKPIVKEWIHELKDAIYAAEDILDEIATEALQRKLNAEFQTTASKVRNSIYTSLSPFVKEIEPKIKEVLDRLEDLAKQKDVIGLRERVGAKPERLPTTSLVKESDICGRHYYKEAIINSLLSDGVSGNEMGVIAIVGMGGIGKTTLAQLVYNDKRVKEHFNLDSWVCVSEEFDPFEVTKTILESVTSSTCDSKDLNRLQLTLNEKLMGKKFLLVLDDVWNRRYADWEVLSKPFRFGAQGSRVIVTTRDSSVASVMRPIATHHLEALPEEECWSLFAKHAFHDDNSDTHPKLEEIGKQIVKKCDGLPLAAKTIGAILRSKADVDEWDKVLRSELWNSPIDETGILPALKLSYISLPSYLKRCFAYCSIFPKDYVFKKDQLVLLWMAEGFLQQSENKTMEEVGDDYFDALVSTSLFQQSSWNRSGFVMHDLINDLAKFVAGQFSFRLQIDHSHESVNKTRHLSYLRGMYDTFKRFEALYEAKQLRTFLPLEFSVQKFQFLITRKVPRDILPMLRCLRVLSLSHYRNVTELPESIEKIRLLRYLNLSHTRVKRLPDSICKLCNLQTLKLAGCKHLKVLPRHMEKLINLSHLDITGTGINEMPIELGRLKYLRTLTKFIISKHDGFGIGGLGKLLNLRGNLSILGLQNVEFPTDALDAGLKDRKYLEELGLEWNASDTNISESQRTVLDSLRPHTNLKSLSIKYYSCESFPDWVGHHSFSNIASLHLENCKYCHSLPPLGQLPFLQELSIEGFDGIVTVGPEFYGGTGSSSIKPFGALKVLRFTLMFNWEKWFPFGSENEGGAFPHLGELYIHNCLKLTGELPLHIPSLAKLEIKLCNEALFKEVPTGMQELTVQGFGALESLPRVGLPFTLETLEIEDCRKLGFPMHLDSLEILVLINSCDSLVYFPLYLFPNLNRIEIKGCSNLESLIVPEQYEHDLELSWISIDDCPKFVSFAKGGLRAPDLWYLRVKNCESLRSLPDKMHLLLPSLQCLNIENCPKVASFPEGGLPSNLWSLWIRDCEKLIANRMGWGLQKLTSLGILTIGGTSEDVESFPEAGLLPTTLIELTIVRFQNLKSLEKNGIEHLSSLERLFLSYCPQLKYMPEDGLPDSISLLSIFDCPLLKKQLRRKKGREWRKIAHVPSKWIDDEFD